jgi:hypothetical protein
MALYSGQMTARDDWRREGKKARPLTTILILVFAGSLIGERRQKMEEK